MFWFIKKVFSSFNLSNLNSLECISMKNQECKAIPKITDVNSDELLFYPYEIKVNICNGGCKNINDPYAKLCVPDIIKNINVKVFILMKQVTKTRHNMA